MNGAFVGVGSPVELPHAVEAFPVIAVLGQHEAGTLVVGKREEPRVGLLLVQGEVLGALPFGAVGLEGVGIVKTGEDFVGSDGEADGYEAEQEEGCCFHSEEIWCAKI